MFNNERAANALCAGMRVTGCNTEIVSPLKYIKYIPLSLCVGCVCEYRYAGKPEEGVRFSGNGVTYGCDIPDMDI